MRFRRRFGFGRKMLQAASVFAIVLSGASFASADIPDTGEHSVAYSVTSFRYLELDTTDTEGCAVTDETQRALCAVDFGVLRNGESTDAAGGTLWYATTLAYDKISASLDFAMENGVYLGVVAQDLQNGEPCTGAGGAGEAATGGDAIETSVATTAQGAGSTTTAYTDVVELTAADADVIVGIQNCGASDKTDGNQASLFYILDTVDANDVDQNDTNYGDFTAVKVVTYVIEADTPPVGP